MRRILILTGVLVLVALPLTAAAHPRVKAVAAVRHCGSFKFGTDGARPGPSGITAKGVSCWFARATALLGPGPGWRCHIAQGLLFACKPRHGDREVTFFGE
jgi:hypothetical protein